MKTTSLIFSVFLLTIMLSASCGMKENKQHQAADQNESMTPKPQDNQIISEEPGEANNESATGMVAANHESKEMVARFVKFSPSTSGTIFVFEDKEGEEHWFHKASDVVGMDFIKDMQPMVEPEGYDHIWFKVTFENREVERAGETRTEATIVAVERQANENADEGRKLAFTAEDLKKAVFSGTEPFWSLYFKDDHILKVSPMGEEILYYFKDGVAAQKELADVIIPVSPVVVEMQVTDEAMSLLATITIIRETCSDGMSDRDYPYTISLNIEDGTSMNGCGRVDE